MTRSLIHQYRRWLPLIVGLLAGVLAWQMQADAGRGVAVVVLKHDLPLYSPIGPSDVELREVAGSLVHPESIGDVELAVGRFLLRPTAAGEPLLFRYLQAVDASGSAVGALAGDRWVFSLDVPEDGLSYEGWEPGDRLSLLFVSERRETGRRESRLLISGLPVLNVSAERDGGGVRLLVPMTEIESIRLGYASASGRLIFLREGHESVSRGHVEDGLLGDEWIWSLDEVEDGGGGEVWVE